MSFIKQEAKTKRYSDQILRGLASELILKEKLVLTHNRAKMLQSFVERLITLAKRGDLSSRRRALGKIVKISNTPRVKQYETNAVIEKLFNELATRFKDRNGGYTRVIKYYHRIGDNALMSCIALLSANENQK